MTSLYSTIFKQGVNQQRVALEFANEKVTYDELKLRVAEVSMWLQSFDCRSVVLQAQNSIDWMIADIACQHLHIVFTPIPLFFSPHQYENVLASVCPDLILTEQRLALCSINCPLPYLNAYINSEQADVKIPTNTSKITFTSGSTGSPKGVCLSTQNQLVVAQSLVETIDIAHPRHLCLLPLPTLLENIAGVYAPLLANGTVIVATDEQRGFSGSQLVDPSKLLACITQAQPNTLILVPELLQVLIFAAQSDWTPPQSLNFIAVGGSRVATSTIKTARDLGLPVCQGYGLSECASVVSLCRLEDDIESCGKPLSHIKTRVEAGSLRVSGNTFLGYLGDPISWAQTDVDTGDIVLIEDGLLYIQGRKKNILINSLGRNICPEWIESELLATGVLKQAVVIGEAKAYCSAILVPVTDNISTVQLLDLIQQINLTLPDYARIHNPIITHHPMTPDLGLYTANMRPKRDAINHYFSEQIANIY